MSRIHFTVPGNPKAQKRHRSWQKGQARGTYDPSASDKADFLVLCRDNAPERPIEGAVGLSVVFWMPVPKSCSKRIKEEIAGWDGLSQSLGIELRNYYNAMFVGDTSTIIHIKRPDVDNLVKHLKDALTGIYWRDDSQIQIHCAYKLYSHRPRTELEIIY